MGFFSDLWSGIKNKVSNVYNSAKQGISNMWNNHVSPFIRKIPVVGNLAADTIESAGRGIDSGLRAAGNLAEGKLKDFAKNTINAGAEYVGSKIPIAGGLVSEAIKSGAEHLKRGGVVQGPAYMKTGGFPSFVMHDGIPVPLGNKYMR
jgi:hypothetical protein